MQFSGWFIVCSIALVLFLVLFCKKAVHLVVATQGYKNFFASFQKRFGELAQDSLEPTKRDLFGHLESSLRQLNGDVLEIGIGAGANLLYYPRGTSLIAVDPNPLNEQLLRDNIRTISPNVLLKNYFVASCEDMTAGVADRSIAAVVCTFLLCSLTEAQIRKTLVEVKRVLKAGGRFFFLEHVQAEPGTMRRYLQRLVESLGIWAFLFDECRVDRQTWVYLEEAGFKRLTYKKRGLEPFPGKWSLKAHIALYVTAWSIAGYAEV